MYNVILSLCIVSMCLYIQVPTYKLLPYYISASLSYIAICIIYRVFFIQDYIYIIMYIIVRAIVAEVVR